MADNDIRPTPPERVNFLTIEDYGEELILSFAIAAPGMVGDVVSLILMWSKYDYLLPEEERGVSVSHESYPEETGRELLRRLVWTEGRVEVESTVRRYHLNISWVDASEVRQARRLLKRMNADGRFVLLFP